MRIQFRSGEITERNGSHMPLDTEIHWNWRNPLNLIVGIILFFCIVALIGALL
jgi:hypothetical protein